MRTQKKKKEKKNRRYESRRPLGRTSHQLPSFLTEYHISEEEEEIQKESNQTANLSSTQKAMIMARDGCSYYRVQLSSNPLDSLVQQFIVSVGWCIGGKTSQASSIPGHEGLALVIPPLAFCLLLIPFLPQETTKEIKLQFQYTAITFIALNNIYMC